MSEHALIVEVRLLADRWHGSSGYPSSPFRLFQALVAGAYGGRWRASEPRENTDAVFRWLESLPPPIVLSPRSRPLKSVTYFVPNNDLDSKGNDPRRVAEIRAQKVLKATMLESDDPFAFIWAFDGATDLANGVVSLSERLHTFGRGVDAAYARGMIVDAQTADVYSARHGGARFIPSLASGGVESESLECPTSGSLESLHHRYNSMLGRIQTIRNEKGKIVGSVFSQPPKADMATIAYARPARKLIFEILDPQGQAFYPVRIEHATRITTAARDLAFTRLAAVADEPLRQRLVLGRGTGDADRSQRLRFIPLPSIGHRYTDASIRRIVVELPPDCPFDHVDVAWALAGQPLLVDKNTGEVQAMLVPGADAKMLQQYVGRNSKRWQTVTPAVLPIRRVGGKIDGRERSDLERSLAAAVCEALRHSGITARPIDIRVQREPLVERGTSARNFEPDRFGVARLHHVEIRFADPVSGPILIGDGRWLGLGLMRPVREREEHAQLPVSEDADAEIAEPNEAIDEGEDDA